MRRQHVEGHRRAGAQAPGVRQVSGRGAAVNLFRRIFLVHVANDGLTHWFEPRAASHWTAFVTESCPQHGVTAAANRGLCDQAESRPDLATRMVAI
jgi:hypothetical protein